MSSFEQLNRRYGPWVSLALGVAAVVYMRRCLGFAPVAVGVLMLARVGAAALRRLAPVIVSADSAGEPITPVPRWRRLVLPAAGGLVVSLWQNVLFYLLPLWWASAVPGSWKCFLSDCAGRDGAALMLRASLARLGAGPADRSRGVECRRAVRDAGPGRRRSRCPAAD